MRSSTPWWSGCSNWGSKPVLLPLRTTTSLAARACGLNIPDTLISNYKPHVIEFLSRPGHGFVAKAVKHSFIRRGGEVLLAGTQRLPKHYSEQLDDYAPLPMTYQREVLKDTDLRIIIVGQKVFATAIRIPESVPPTVDWRTAQLHGEELPHERIVLPQSIERKCGQLLAHFRLNFASMDMIKDESGHYIFLELNPNGQWAWIEQLTGYPIRDAIIDHLTSVRAS